MAPTRRDLLGTATTAVTLAVAGCTGDGGGQDDDGSDGSDGSDGGMTATDTPTESMGSGGATVQVRSHPELGDILVDGEGMTLYMFDSDTQGQAASTCYDGCANAWPPLTVDGEPSAGDGVGAELTTFDRDTGETQVSANGWPLYYFQSDSSPGDVSGQGVNGVWWVLGPDGTPKRPDATPTPTEGAAASVEVSDHPEYGEILVDGEGMTLYMFDSDTQGAGSSTCSGGCANAWPPLTVDGDVAAGENVSAELSTFERSGGGTQVAANGWPLYYFQSDSSPGDATGQGVNGVWWVLGPDGQPKRPTVRTRSTDEYGDILVGPQGETLYMFDSDTQGAGASTCSGGCATAWPPLTVDGNVMAGSGVEAELTTFEREGGDTQVAANGWPLYYFQSDSEPGDTEGQGANDVWWLLDPAGEPIRGSGGATPTETQTATPTDDGSMGY